jgi:alpha-D-ribose 1-methylphosphonate 5-triphosphate synthase subunit PhnG
LLQDPAQADALEEQLISPSEHMLAEQRVLRQRKAAATKVNFFTMVRGEDAS